MTKRVFIGLLACLAILLGILSLAGLSYTKPIDIPAGLAGTHVHASDAMLRVVQKGKGRDVLFLHGSIGSLEDAEPLIPILSRYYRVTSFDRVGHGYSSLGMGPASIASNARYTSLLIQKLHLENVIVVGHSYGGSVALQLALNNTPEVSAYLLLAPAAYFLSETRAIEHVFATPVFGLGLLRLARPWLAPGMLADGLDRAVTPDADAFDKRFFDFRLRLWNNTGILYTRTQQTAHIEYELRGMAPRYPDIRTPMIIMLGADEPFNDITRGSQRLAQVVPGAELITLPHTGHYIQYRQPLAVINAVDRLAEQSMPSKR